MQALHFWAMLHMWAIAVHCFLGHCNFFLLFITIDSGKEPLLLTIVTISCKTVKWLKIWAFKVPMTG